MPIAPFTINQIESFQPALDAKAGNRIFVTAGRNYAWDAKGPYAAYGSRLLDADEVIAAQPHIVQSLPLGVDKVLVAAGNNIIRYDVGTSAWVAVQTLVPIEANPLNVRFSYRKWTTAYLQAGLYACCQNYGAFKVNPGTDAFTNMNTLGIAGFPATPVIAICETNGRMIYMTATTVYWSGANAPENLTPAVGGPGLQVIAARVSGTPVALTSIPNGFIAWTTEGAMVAEFVGGDSVFRFYKMTTDVLPVNAFGIEKLPDGSHVIFTETGIYRTVNGGQPESFSPIYNEYLREVYQYSQSIEVMLYYSSSEQRLYVSFRRSTQYFTDTHVLNMTLDKWGQFNQGHLGILRYAPGRGKVGYIDQNGVGHYFFPKSAKFRLRELATAPGEFTGLDSSITLGYIRIEELRPRADSMQEIQEILVNRDIISLSIGDIAVDEGLLDESDWIIVDEGLLTDLTNSIYDESPEGELPFAPLYELEVLGEIFGSNAIYPSTKLPMLAKRSARTDLWTCLSQSFTHQLRFSARLLNQYWELGTIRLSISYSGEQS